MGREVVCKCNNPANNKPLANFLTSAFSILPSLTNWIKTTTGTATGIYVVAFIMRMDRPRTFTQHLRAHGNTYAESERQAFILFLKDFTAKGYIAKDDQRRYYLTTAGKVLRNQLIAYIQQLLQPIEYQHTV